MKNMHFEIEGAGGEGLEGTCSDCLDFRPRDFDGGDRKAVRGLHFGGRQDNSKREGDGQRC